MIACGISAITTANTRSFQVASLAFMGSEERHLITVYIQYTFHSKIDLSIKLCNVDVNNLYHIQGYKGVKDDHVKIQSHG